MRQRPVLTAAGVDEVLLCLCTCPSREVAEDLAQRVVGAGLAACVNILPGLTSVYRWQGAVETASEVLLLAKTTASRYPALEAALLAAHPYELPEVIGVSIHAGLPGYLQWIKDSLA